MSEALKNKSIVVIGGTTGIGFSAARALLKAGAAVVIVGRNPDNVNTATAELNDITPNKSHGLAGDAVQSDTVNRAIALCLESFGSFDGLYHVAGGSGRRYGDGPLHEVTDEGIAKTLELNLHSLIYSNRAAVRSFLDREVSGSVLNMGSVLGSSPSPHYFSTHVYAAAKSAVVGFTQSIAAYYASKQIRFNVIAPALVESPMSQRAAEDEAIKQFIKSKQPLDGGRIGRPEDLDELALYLLSDHSKFVTGQVIAVDGGWSLSDGQVP